jgi:hypothetical protein
MTILRLFHGTNKNFNRFDQSLARMTQDYYGGGVCYLTDTYDVAVTYARAMTKKYLGQPIVYEVVANFKNIFDVDNVYTGKDLIKLIPADIEGFARGARLISFGSDKYTIISNIHAGTEHLTGEQIFLGLSRGMVQTAKARDSIKRVGYDALRYNGGRMTGGAGLHNVYIAYKANDLKIQKKIMIDETKYKIKPTNIQQQAIFRM